MGFEIKLMGNDVLFIKMKFGILGVVLTRVWCSILMFGSRLDLGLARWSLTETHGLGVIIFSTRLGVSCDLWSGWFDSWLIVDVLVCRDPRGSVWQFWSSRMSLCRGLVALDLSPCDSWF